MAHGLLKVPWHCLEDQKSEAGMHRDPSKVWQKYIWQKKEGKKKEKK